MRKAMITSTAILLCCVASAAAQDVESQLAAAEGQARGGDFDGSLAALEPLLTGDGLNDRSRQRVRDLAAAVLHARGAEHFRHARMEESVADFDRQIELDPTREAEHWQRGIAYYYLEEYAKGAAQFELHRTVNPQDVENAAWHFLCVVRMPDGSIEAARKNLIPVGRDARVPMAEIQRMFAGELPPEEVLAAGAAGGELAAFYADLYVGLYYEALERPEDALRVITQAAENPAAQRSYMGDVARVHVLLREKSTRPAEQSGAEGE